MIKTISVVLLLLCIPVIGHAQSMPETYHEFRYGRLEYGFYVPESYDGTGSYPLIMYLHGWGNNYTVYLDWYDSDIQSENPCFVFTPRTPTTWADWSGWWDQLTEPMMAALHVLDSLIAVYPIDTSRLYVYGISMGGEGTFDLLDKLPNKFAAAMSVCGGGQPFWAEHIAQTPFWMFHGGSDTINPPRLTEQVYDELVRLGATKMRYKKYPGYGHEIWDVAASEPSWHDWMFAHSREDTSCPKPGGEIHLNDVVMEGENIRLSWNDINNPDKRADQIWYYKIFNKDSVIETVEYDQTTCVFPVIHSVDTFKVTAVNYHFKESDPSNLAYFNSDSVSARIHHDNHIHPDKVILYGNYPNPFNARTVIRYSLPESDIVSLRLYDLIGREIYTMENAFKTAGNHHVTLNANNLNSGIYFYKFEVGEFSNTKKLVLIR